MQNHLHLPLIVESIEKEHAKTKSIYKVSPPLVLQNTKSCSLLT
jgi:hypothetical protein